MNLNSKQADAVIRLYTEALKGADSDTAMLKTVEELAGEFAASVPKWADRLKEKLRAENMAAAEGVLDGYLERQATQSEEPARTSKVELVTNEPDPIAEAKKAADHRDYVERHMKYVQAMGLANTAFQTGRIGLREYKYLEECFARFYKFADGSLARRRKPPEDSVFVSLHEKRARRTYTQHTPEYWKNFTCPAKRKKPDELAADEDLGGDEQDD